MTFEELKQEANALGYRLVKKPAPSETLLPCTCGCRRREHWGKYLGDGKFKVTLVCMRCHREVSGPTLSGARRAWNKEISESNDKTRS